MKIPHLLCSTEHSCVSLATGSDQSSQLYGWNPSPTLSHLPHSPGFWKLFWGPHKVQSPQPGPIKRPAQCSTRLQASPGTARGTNRRGGWAWRGSGWPRLGSVGPSASPASQALLLLFRPLFSLFAVNSCAKKPGRCHPVTSRGWVRGSPAERRFEGVEKKMRASVDSCARPTHRTPAVADRPSTAFFTKRRLSCGVVLGSPPPPP